MPASYTAIKPAQVAAPPKLHYITALRGWAILLVVLVHNGLYGATDARYFVSVWKTVVNQGARGVQLFFVISAFTLFLSMAKRKQERHPTRNFFIRRFFRIAPMYYVGIVFYSFWFSQVQPPQPAVVTPANVLANLTFLHGVSPYWINSLVPGGWSITVEMCFYILAPWLFQRLRTVDQAVRFLAWAIVASCLLSIGLTALRPIADAELWYAYLFSFFPNQLPVFGFGILLYLLAAPSEHAKTLRPTTYLLAAGTMLFVLATGFGNNFLLRTGAVSEGQHYWFAAAFVLLALGLRAHSPRLLVNPVINYLGEISFSLYLVHFVPLFILSKLGRSDLITPVGSLTALLGFGLRYLLVLASSVVVATFFYRAIELPGQQLGKRLIVFLEK